MSDKDLRDDMLKLVRYKILFVKRDYEHAFQEQEELVPDNIDEAAYIAWKIAAFIQQLREQRHTTVPATWKQYPPHQPQYREGRTLVGFPEADKKYLRVSYMVLDRWPRQARHFEEEQLKVLKQIRDSLRRTRPPPRPGIREQLLTTLRDEGLQTAALLAQTLAAEVEAVQTALEALVEAGQVGRWEGQYGTAAQVGLLAVLRRVQRYLSARELQDATRQPLAAVRDSLRTLEAAGQVQRRGSRYGLPEW